MNIKGLSDWVDAVATVGVVIGLVLLILEIRVNTDAIEHQAAVDRAIVVSEPFYESAELRSAMNKIRIAEGHEGAVNAFIENYDMTPDEAIVWSRHQMQVWAMIRADFERGDRENAEYFATLLLKNRPPRIFVENMAYRGEFKEMIQNILDQQKSDGQKKNEEY